MLLNFYNLAEQPFGVTPDSRFLYLGPQHREALASLMYNIENTRGFVAMIAKPGMGKTSLLYHCLETLRDRARTAFVFRTDCNAREFMHHVLMDLGVDVPSDDLPSMHEALNRVLTEERREMRLPLVLVIDEAQNLSESVLESIRLLSNFETPCEKLMQIVLAGQPQLAEVLARPSMVQLRQRIAQVLRIQPLNREEVSEYIDFRLEAGGCRNLAVFTAGARGAIAHYSEGIPRNINTICFAAMSLACAMRRKTVDRSIVVETMSDLALGPAAGEVIAEAERTESKRAGATHVQARLRKIREFLRRIPRFGLGIALLAIFILGTPVNVNEPRAVAGPGARPSAAEKAVAAGSVAPQAAPGPEVPDTKPPTGTKPSGWLIADSGATLYVKSEGSHAYGSLTVLSFLPIKDPDTREVAGG